MRDVYLADTSAEAATLLDKAIVACRGDDITKARFQPTGTSWTNEHRAHPARRRGEIHGRWKVNDVSRVGKPHEQRGPSSLSRVRVSGNQADAIAGMVIVRAWRKPRTASRRAGPAASLGRSTS